MKRFITFLLTAVLLLLTVLPLTAFADGFTINVSEELKTITIDGDEYFRYNGEVTEFYHDDIHNVTLSFEGGAGDDVLRYQVSGYYTLSYKIEYTFEDGSVLTSYYLRHDYIDTFNKVDAGIGVDCYVSFGYESSNVVYFDREGLFGEKTVIYEYDVMSGDYFHVYTASDDQRIECFQGYLLYSSGSYYFVDPMEQNYDFEVYRIEAANGYKITDPYLLAKLEKAMEIYNGDGLAFLDDDSFADDISTVMLIVVFGILPLAALITAVIFMLCSKSKYKKLYTVIVVLSTMLLTVVGILIYIFQNA